MFGRVRALPGHLRQSRHAREFAPRWIFFGVWALFILFALRVLIIEGDIFFSQQLHQLVLKALRCRIQRRMFILLNNADAICRFVCAAAAG